MTLKKIDSLPKFKRKVTNTNWFAVLDGFMDSDAKLVKVEDERGEYSSPFSMYASLRVAVVSRRYAVEAFMRNGEVYLQKTL